MLVLRMVIPSSPSKSVVLSAIYREILADGVPGEIRLVSDSGRETFEAVRRVFDRLPWAGAAVLIHEVGGVEEWFRALVAVDADVVDVTPGRKVHALALYTQAVARGLRVRYSYLVDEGRFGYMYPGYAPPKAVRLLEVHPSLASLTYRIPGELSTGSWEGTASIPEIHAAVNTARVRWAQLRIDSRLMRVRISLGNEPFSVEELGGPAARACLQYSSMPANAWGAAEEVRRCVRRRCAVVLDTSALMAGMNEFFTRVVGGYGSVVRHVEPVMREVTNFLEMKHSPEGSVRKLAYLDALAAGDAVAPAAARMWRGGDKEIINALREVTASHACTCFVTADRNLADAVEAVGNVRVILLRYGKDYNLVEESLPKLLRCAAVTGPSRVSVGGLRLSVRDARMVSGEVRAEVSAATHGRLMELLSALVREALAKGVH